MDKYGHATTWVEYQVSYSVDGIRLIQRLLRSKETELSKLYFDTSGIPLNLLSENGTRYHSPAESDAAQTMKRVQLDGVVGSTSSIGSHS